MESTASRLGVCALCVCLRLSAAGAEERNQASPSKRVVVEVASCAAVSTEALRHMLGIEIGDLLAPADVAAAAGDVRLTVRCAGTVAWVEAAGTDGSGAVDRTFRLDDFPGDAAPRALALAGLELLAARSPAVRARIEATQRAVPQPPAAKAPNVVGAAAAHPAPSPTRLRLGLGATWRRFLVEQGVSAWGGQAFVDWDPGHRWHLHVDVEGAGAQREVPLGGTSAVLLSCGGTAGARAGDESLGLALAVGARLGLARLAGSPAEQVGASADSAIRPWAGPVARVSAWAGAGPVVLLVSVEVGRSLGKTRGTAGGAPVLVMQDTWLAVSLGSALRM